MQNAHAEVGSATLRRGRWMGRFWMRLVGCDVGSFAVEKRIGR
jgi:hypothetical protein